MAGHIEIRSYPGLSCPELGNYDVIKLQTIACISRGLHVYLSADLYRALQVTCHWK